MKKGLMSDSEIKERLRGVVLRAWQDKEFLAELQRNPRKVMKESGIELGEGIKVTFHVDTLEHRHFVIPLSPAWVLRRKVEEELKTLATLHVEIACSRSWDGSHQDG